MLDAKIRPYIDPPLNAMGQALAKSGLKAQQVTLAGFIFGLGAFLALALESYAPALLFIALSRLMDGLDGPVARASEEGPTDRGAFLDIVSDFIFYGGFAFFFAVGRPETALAAAFLIFSFMGTASSFLTYSILATKQGRNHSRQGKKSFYYAAGLCEGSETIIFFLLFCLLPNLFTPLAVLFGILCWITTAGRTAQAYKEFSS